jgi:hypothetical protein
MFIKDCVQILPNNQIVTTPVASTIYDPFVVNGNWTDMIARVDNDTIYGYRFHPTTIFYAPATNTTDELMRIVERSYHYSLYFSLHFKGTH